MLAFQCDVTRVATFMQENPFNSRSFSFLGVSGNHHSLSHHGGDAAKQAAQQKINTFEVTQLAYLLDSLAKAARRRRQSVLHNSIVLFTSDFGDGDDHYHWDLPMLVAGRAGGRWKPGRHIAYPHQGGGGPAQQDRHADGQPVHLGPPGLRHPRRHLRHRRHSSPTEPSRWPSWRGERAPARREAALRYDPLTRGRCGQRLLSRLQGRQGRGESLGYGAHQLPDMISSDRRRTESAWLSLMVLPTLTRAQMASSQAWYLASTTAAAPKGPSNRKLPLLPRLSAVQLVAVADHGRVAHGLGDR